jgi:hypothetical protein
MILSLLRGDLVHNPGCLASNIIFFLDLLIFVPFSSNQEDLTPYVLRAWQDLTAHVLQAQQDQGPHISRVRGPVARFK